MKKLKSIIAAAVCVSLTACAASTGFSGSEILSDDVKRSKDTAATFNYADGCREAPLAYNSFTNTVTGFSLKLFRNAYNGKAISLAPASSAVQLGLLANGAKGDSRTEILLALGVELGSAFLQTNADFYGDDIIRYDFSKGADKLKDRVGVKMTLSGEDSMASYSELSLSDTWLNQSLSCEEVSMQTKTARGIVKYTANNPLRALFIMPEGDFETYVKSFDSVEYSKLLESIDFTKRQAAVISSFRTEAQSANLSPVLQKIGLYTLFGENSDFGSLTHGGELTLNKFVCAAPSLSVGSSGIGSAATADSAEGEKPDGAWVFDKPFIFMLVDNETDIPVYISTVE